MLTRKIHECECPACRQDGDHRERALHANVNLLLSRLNEQQRRWYAGVESQRIGHGGDRLLSLITGMDEDTISRGRREMSTGLKDRPTDRIRVAGGGRPSTEKKSPS
jgi:hypothetical protein